MNSLALLDGLKSAWIFCTGNPSGAIKGIREISIRMAVGARGRDILFQFLVEAVVLSSFSGILGIFLGMVSSKVISSLAHWPTLIAATVSLKAHGG